ncbi:hypothetical protein [Streptomyces eurythermus]|uniref:hypothetical protein n=1 Tax=Streptomyces eurythermus TaxID=42237 RepID=UPI0033C1141C
MAAVTGAGTALGTETAQMASGLVRETSGGSEQGRAALTGLDRAPGDSAAADRLHAALRDALDADPAFARRLFSLFEAPPPPQRPPAPPGSVVIGDGNRLRGSSNSLGPLTISTTRGGPGPGGVGRAGARDRGARRVRRRASDRHGRLARPRGSGTASQQDAGGAGASADGADNSLAGGRLRPVLKNRDVVKSVLPGLDAVPGGWTQESAPKVLEAGAAQCRTDPPSVSFRGEAEYKDPSTDNVAEFEVYALSSVSAARSACQTTRKDTPPSMALPALGDESHAFGRQDNSSGKTVTSVVRFGRVVVGVTYRIEAVDWTEAYGGDHLEILTRMLVDRARQACEGRAPTARAVL